jgi:peptidoglycan/xylan/chitin deacetylase (PgdA/CDA1 family)
MRADALLPLAGAAVWCAPAAAPVVPPIASAFRLPLRLAERRGIALTFDDGPHREGTPAVLEALRDGRATATFFLVGEQVARFRSLAAEIAAAGHTIGVHGYRHTLLLRRLPRAVRDDLARAADEIGSATGTEPALYRPPYGVFSLPALRLVRGLGWSPYLWSRWGRDWDRGATAASIAAIVTRDLAAGDVVLLHDADHYSSAGSWLATAAAVPAVLEAADRLGEPLVALSHSR